MVQEMKGRKGKEGRWGDRRGEKNRAPVLNGCMLGLGGKEEKQLGCDMLGGWSGEGLCFDCWDMRVRKPMWWRQRKKERE
jgi:hypothetical protein